MYRLLAFFSLILLLLFSCKKEERFLIVWDKSYSTYPNRFCTVVNEDTLYRFFGRYIVYNYDKNYERVDSVMVKLINNIMQSGPLYSGFDIELAMVKNASTIEAGEYIYEERNYLGRYYWDIIDHPFEIKKENYTRKATQIVNIPFNYDFDLKYGVLLKYISINDIRGIKCERNTIVTKWMTPEPVVIFHYIEIE